MLLMRTEGQSSAVICADCGLRSEPGEAACGELRDLLLARDFEQPVLYWQYHRLAVDTYCVQHADYVKSAKSFAAHLCGLCIALERGNDQEAMRALQRWLSTNPALHKPELPKFRGALTVRHLHGISDPEAYGKAVSAWARSAWEAYRPLHPIAREWLSRSAACVQKRK